MKHPLTVEKYDGSLKELAEDLGNLSYDALAEFLGHLESKMKKDSIADSERGRHKLAKQLGNVGMSMVLARESAEKAWDICKPHMKQD